MNYLEKVEEFHRCFDAPVLKTPQFPSKERCELRVELLREELQELIDNINAGNLVEVADAFGDLQVVLSGAILEFGMGDVFNDIFENINNSNMSKACITEQEANDTINFYKEKDNTEAYSKKIGDKWVVYRSADNKILKSVNYTKANPGLFL